MRSAAKQLALIPLAAACVVGIAQAATVTSPKIIIENMSGQEIPITGTVSFQADGDLRVQCRLENGNCPSIGTGNGGSGTNPPTISSFTASATTITAGQSVTLSWNSTGDVCFAESPAGITGWTGNSLAKAASQAISGLAVGTYTFGLRCYTAGGSATASTPSITVQQGSTNPPPPPPADYCGEYYSAGLPTSAPGFNAHNWNKVERDFSTIFGILPGDAMTASDVKWLTGLQVPAAFNNYLAIPFTMTDSSGLLSEFLMRWFQTQIAGASPGAVSVTVSPCAGDFRASTAGDPVTDIYLRGVCRRSFGQSGTITVSSDPQSATACFAPVGKRMYINIAAANMFESTAPATSSCTGNPAPSNCGVSVRHD
jgi:hypothetical protein